MMHGTSLISGLFLQLWRRSRPQGLKAPEASLRAVVSLGGAMYHLKYEHLFIYSWLCKMLTEAASPQAPELSDSCEVFHLDPAKVAALRRVLLQDGSAVALAETFKVLGDTTRIRIVDAIARCELCVCDIARLLGLSESAVSHQLRLLRGMRLVRPRRAGRMVFYALDDQHIVRLLEQGLEHVEERK